MNSGLELDLLAGYFGFFLALGLLFLAVAPILVWKNSARTNVLLRRLIEEQERTSDLLALLLKNQAESGHHATTEDKAFTLEEE